MTQLSGDVIPPSSPSVGFQLGISDLRAEEHCGHSSFLHLLRGKRLKGKGVVLLRL